MLAARRLISLHIAGVLAFACAAAAYAQETTPVVDSPAPFSDRNIPLASDSTLACGYGVCGSSVTVSGGTSSVTIGKKHPATPPPPPPPPPPPAEPSCATRLASSAWQPSTQTQNRWVNASSACPAGQVGAVTWQAEQKSTRTASCSSPSAAVDPAWSGWSGWSATGATRDVSNSCQTTCATRLNTSPWNASPQTQTRWVNASAACPAGQIGSHTWQAQESSSRSAFCSVSKAADDPSWTGWSAWRVTGAVRNESNTCHKRIPPPPPPPPVCRRSQRPCPVRE